MEGRSATILVTLSFLLCFLFQVIQQCILWSSSLFLLQQKAFATPCTAASSWLYSPPWKSRSWSKARKLNRAKESREEKSDKEERGRSKHSELLPVLFPSHSPAEKEGDSSSDNRDGRLACNKVLSLLVLLHSLIPASSAVSFGFLLCLLVPSFLSLYPRSRWWDWSVPFA